MLTAFINPNENSLTASVFSHLLHLPTELWWQLLREACRSGRLPTNVGELRSVDFRPKWDPTEVATGNNTYVEPDLFLRFDSLDLIVEAKRWDQHQQNPRQWAAQLRAYWNQYASKQKHAFAPGQVQMIALGGLWTTEDKEVSVQVPGGATGQGGAEPITITCPVHMCRWGWLLTRCQGFARELERLRHPSSQTHAHRRILGHLVAFFESHDFRTGMWYEELWPRIARLGPTLPASQKIFRTLKARTLPR